MMGPGAMNGYSGYGNHMMDGGYGTMLGPDAIGRQNRRYPAQGVRPYEEPAQRQK